MENPSVYKRFIEQTVKPSKRPKLFWYCRTPEGWRYLTDTTENRKHIQGRHVIRENISVDGKSKRIYTPLKENETPQQALQNAMLRAVSAARKRVPTKTHDGLKKAMNDYIADREAHGKLEAAEHARHTLPEFRSICPQVSTVTGVTRQHLTAFCAALRKRGQSPRTVSNKYDRIRSFLKFAGSDVQLSKSDRPKFDKTLPTTYTKAETDALLAHATDYMKVVICLGLQLGLRDQEMMHAEWDDIDREHRTFRVKSKPVYDFGVKDAEERDIPIPASLFTMLNKWRESRPGTSLILGVGEEFQNTNGHLLRTLQRMAKRCNVENATLHKLRRTYLTRLLQSGTDIRTVQAFAGHADLESSMRYLRPAGAKEMLSHVDAIDW